MPAHSRLPVTRQASPGPAAPPCSSGKKSPQTCRGLPGARHATFFSQDGQSCKSAQTAWPDFCVLVTNCAAVKPSPVHGPQAASPCHPACPLALPPAADRAEPGSRPQCGQASRLQASRGPSHPAASRERALQSPPWCSSCCFGLARPVWCGRCSAAKHSLQERALWCQPEAASCQQPGVSQST